MNRKYGRTLPLTHQEFYVLAALAWRSLHAYRVLQEVSHYSEGTVVMTRSTVRAVLARQLAAGRIEVVEDPDPFPSHKRGPTYHLTPSGRRVLEAELRRLDRAATIARFTLSR